MMWCSSEYTTYLILPANLFQSNRIAINQSHSSMKERGTGTMLCVPYICQSLDILNDSILQPKLCYVPNVKMWVPMGYNTIMDSHMFDQ